MSQALPTQSATGNGNTRLRLPRTFTGELTVAGMVPTITEVRTALEAVFEAIAPTIGDQVGLAVDDVLKLRAVISSQTSGDNDIFDVNFFLGEAPDAIEYFALIVQTGMY